MPGCTIAGREERSSYVVFCSLGSAHGLGEREEGKRGERREKVGGSEGERGERREKVGGQEGGGRREFKLELVASNINGESLRRELL